MTEPLPVHPDRRATTLAQRQPVPQDEAARYAKPRAGSADARVRLKLLQHELRCALDSRGTEAARARLAPLDSPDLWAGTIQDGAARGFAVALEEAISLCQAEPDRSTSDADEEDATVTTGRDLRRRRDIVIKSAGARVRFSRKAGVTFVDRATELSVPDCVRFEDRSDAGELDEFKPVDGERARIFSPAYLRLTELLESEQRTRLTLSGTLGRSGGGFPCQLRFEGTAAETAIIMRLRIRNDRNDHRLRIRVHGIETAVHHRGTPGWERVHARGKTFVAGTIVRATGRLRVGDEFFNTPDAQCPGWIEHVFALGTPTDPSGWSPVRL